LSDAPYLGEAAVLFVLTRKPFGVDIVTDPGTLPWFVYARILFGLSLVAYEILSTVRKTRRYQKHKARLSVPIPAAQVSLWWTLMVGGVFVLASLSFAVGLIMLLTAQLIPFQIKTRTEKTDSAPPNTETHP
jgi:hypothetical protein